VGVAEEVAAGEQGRILAAFAGGKEDSSERNVARSSRVEEVVYSAVYLL